jgi:hypothetical protein
MAAQQQQQQQQYLAPEAQLGSAGTAAGAMVLWKQPTEVAVGLGTLIVQAAAAATAEAAVVAVQQCALLTAAAATARGLQVAEQNSFHWLIIDAVFAALQASQSAARASTIPAVQATAAPAEQLSTAYHHCCAHCFAFAGFTKRSESEYDPFGAGHSSTSISAGLGMAVGRDIKGKKNNVIAVIGDGAITGGMAYEAMNHAGFLDSNMIIILNDNQQVMTSSNKLIECICVSIVCYQ